MKTRPLKILIRIHLVTLTIGILNILVKKLSVYSLQGSIEFGIETLTAISGLALFFFYLKPFKRINIYFSIYATAALLLIIGLIFRGIFGALIISLILFPIVPNEKEFENDEIIISTPFQGFIAPCCSYQIKERQFLIFEKDYGEFESEGPIDFETVKINSSDHAIEMTYSTDFDKETVKKKIIKR
ncbi:hypothetical protein [Roseivirga sp. E12]|uniref:hypothetical protein n=1 Tax=Roseivirga sp. E12 TaxID=2819237 RepID=UPI001ABC1BED|nr:hypothetical protein [Roseivirga sp. E12]MBO3697719.1 hypothetical protein [Roseivirga sp. E12]